MPNNPAPQLHPTIAPSSLSPTAEVVIVGGGIVGTATAFFLAKRGIRSVILEAESGLGLRTTSMSAHCIRAQFSEPDNIAMMAESLSFYEEFAERCPPTVAGPADVRLVQQGYLFASTEPGDRGEFETRARVQTASGLDDVEVIDGTEIRHRYPWLSEEIVIGTFRARDGWIDSARAVSTFAEASAAAIVTGVTVLAIETTSGRVSGIRTDQGTISTDTVILAAGPFSGSLSPEPLPLRCWRRHRVIVDPHPDIPQSGPVTIDANTGAHWRPHLGGALIAWAQPESDAPPQWPVEVDPKFPDLVLRSAEGIGRLAPFWFDLAKQLSLEQLLLTAGQYTVTPDHRPLIGAAPQTAGLYLHTGYSGHGIMGCPAGGRLLSDILAGEPSLNPFAPNRFANSVHAPEHERVII